MEIIKKSKQTRAKSKLQPSRVSRLKLPPRDLGEWIRLANLVRPGSDLPDLWPLVKGIHCWPLVLERIARLEDEPLRSELLGYFTPTSAAFREWLETHEDHLKEGKEATDHLLEEVRLVLTLEHYDRIRTAYTHLRMLSRSHPEEKTIDPLESLVSTLRYADLRYLRQCGYCGKIFYAGKATQPGCTPEHSGNIRKQNKRKRDKENRNLKKKRASKAR